MRGLFLYKIKYEKIRMLFALYTVNKIAFFHDPEFERAVRDTLISSRVSMVDRREKALGGIIWKRDTKVLIMKM